MSLTGSSCLLFGFSVLSLRVFLSVSFTVCCISCCPCCYLFSWISLDFLLIFCHLYLFISLPLHFSLILLHLLESLLLTPPTRASTLHVCRSAVLARTLVFHLQRMVFPLLFHPADCTLQSTVSREHACPHMSLVLSGFSARWLFFGSTHYTHYRLQRQLISSFFISFVIPSIILQSPTLSSFWLPELFFPRPKKRNTTCIHHFKR